MCHGCGASGGAYDAALIHGRTPRTAIDLMVEYGLTERRARGRGRRSGASRAQRPAAAVDRPRDSRPAPAPAVTDAQVREWAEALVGDDALLRRLRENRGWTDYAIARHHVGWDGSRIVFGCRDLSGRLTAVYRYAPPWRRRGPKILAVTGSRRSLFPSPAGIGRRCFGLRSDLRQAGEDTMAMNLQVETTSSGGLSTNQALGGLGVVAGGCGVAATAAGAGIITSPGAVPLGICAGVAAIGAGIVQFFA